MSDIDNNSQAPHEDSFQFSDDRFPSFESFIKEEKEDEKEYFSKVANPKQQALLESATVPMEVKEVEPLQVNIAREDDSAYRINPPYGIVGLAAKATSKEQIEDLMDYCLEQSVHFMNNNDYDQSRLFGFRYQVLNGILKGLVDVKTDKE